MLPERSSELLTACVDGELNERQQAVVQLRPQRSGKAGELVWQFQADVAAFGLPAQDHRVHQNTFFRNRRVRPATPLARRPPGEPAVRPDLPPKTNAANERLAQHLWAHRDELFTFLRRPGLDATNWRAELAIRFGVILRKVWGGSRTWAGARAQSVLMSVWRTCWQQGGCALEFLSQLLRTPQTALALPS
jgi:hypothetical protein